MSANGMGQVGAFPADVTDLSSQTDQDMADNRRKAA